jgi:hypothetical protein
VSQAAAGQGKGVVSKESKLRRDPSRPDPLYFSNKAVISSEVVKELEDWHG